MSLRAIKTFDAASRPRTEGRRRLLALRDRSSSEELARVIGVSAQAVRAYATGTRIPTVEIAFMIEDAAIGIPARSWTLTPERFATFVAAERGKKE